MAQLVLTSAGVWLDQYNLTGDLNSVALNYGAELQDSTVFGGTTRTRKGGLKTVTASMEGFHNAGTGLSDEGLFDNIGVADVPMTMAPTKTEGELAYFFKAILAEYSSGATVGEMFAFSVTAEASSMQLIRGTLMDDTTETTTDQGDAVQLGAVGATESVFAVLHILSASAGDTLDVTIDSDDVQNFGGTPETQITFTQVSDEGSQFSESAGAVTDDWWRVDWTIAGDGSESFEFVVAVGIATST